MKLAVYPGSFDPITNGHLDILKRALKVFDKVIVLIASNPGKRRTFSLAERLRSVKEAVKDFRNVSVDSTAGLTIDYARKAGASHLIRGLRAVTDFEYEFQLAAGNSFIDDSIDMIFFMSRSETSFISSSAIRDLYRNGVDISKLVPPSVIEMYERHKWEN